MSLKKEYVSGSDILKYLTDKEIDIRKVEIPNGYKLSIYQLVGQNPSQQRFSFSMQRSHYLSGITDIGSAEKYMKWAFTRINKISEYSDIQLNADDLEYRVY